ncbi:Clp protease ClpB [Algoriphagus marinus]|jgi:hypothetical protein|uniref:Clp protease ClpB n=1 Tax=Algoriphagus marinus TaxID=1925762 RepID=UPI0009FAA2A0|nr:Clp protease ClpB [Algoriphagus marinus]
MMLQIVFLFFSLFNLQVAEAGDAKLQLMIQERDQLQAQWKESEAKKSGIFGNRTKKDMIETNQWLERILAKDNQIMDELRMIGSIETAVIGQEKEDYKTISFRLENQVQALRRALAEKDQAISEKVEASRTFEWASFILFLVCLGMGVWIYRIKKSL